LQWSEIVSVTIGRLQLTVTVAERRALNDAPEIPARPDPAERALLRHRCMKEVDGERDRRFAEAMYRWGRSL
jgi:hypothetical protein